MQCQQRQWYFFLHRNCNSSSSYWMSNIMCKQIPCALWQRFWKAEFMCSELLTIEDTLTSFCDIRYSSLLDAQLYMYTLVNFFFPFSKLCARVSNNLMFHGLKWWCTNVQFNFDCWLWYVAAVLLFTGLTALPEKILRGHNP